MKTVDIDSITVKIIIYSLIAFWFLGSAYLIGSTVEQTFGKIRINQTVQNVDYDRKTGYFCWDWTSIKVRDLKHTSGRVQLLDADQVELLLPLFMKDTLVPWTLNPPINLGKLTTQGLCTFIPPGFSPKMPFEINAYSTYPSYLGLWKLRVYLPRIVYHNDQTHDVFYSTPTQY